MSIYILAIQDKAGYNRRLASQAQDTFSSTLDTDRQARLPSVTTVTSVRAIPVPGAEGPED
jgi:hypothetical protein